MVAGGLITLEGTLRRKNGTTVSIDGWISVIDPTGSQIFCAVAHDVTKYKGAIENLKEDTERFHRLTRDLAGFNRMISAITYDLNLNQAFQLFSDEIQAMLPHDRAAISIADNGRQTSTFYVVSGRVGAYGPGVVVPTSDQYVPDVIRGRSGILVTDFEREQDSASKRLLLSLGLRAAISAPLWCGDHCFGSLDFGNHQAGIYGSRELKLAQDIADQIAAAVINARKHEYIQSLLQSEQVSRRSIEALIHALPLAVISIDQNGMVQTWNQSAVGLFGWRENEVLGRPVPFVPQGTTGKFCGLLESVREGRVLEDVPLRIKRKHGRPIDVVLWASPCRDSKVAIKTVLLLIAGSAGRLSPEPAISKPAVRSLARNTYIGQSSTGESTFLTRRELDVIRLMASGMRNREIADQLFLSVRTVKTHLENTYQKLAVHSRTQAVRVARERGIRVD